MSHQSCAVFVNLTIPHSLDVAHPLQSVALGCWRIPFQTEDQPFLHRVNAFSVVSRLVSESSKPSMDSASNHTSSVYFEKSLPLEGLTASSRNNNTQPLVDGSTETFW